MRIGIDLTCWTNARGYGRYIRELFPAMLRVAPDDTFLCFADPWTAEEFGVSRSNVTVIEVAQGVAPTQGARAGGNRSPIDMLRLTKAVWRASPDVFFSPSVYTYFPLPPRLPAVVTIHDTIAERFPDLTLPTTRARLFWKLKVGMALQQCRLVLTVSDYAAQEIATFHQLSPDRIRVAVSAPSSAYAPSESPDAVAAAARAVQVPDGAKWFTYVGGFNPHKHVEHLVRAHGRLAQEHPEAPPHLLLIGSASRDVFYSAVERVRAAVHAEGTAHLVHWTGFVPDTTLRHLQSGALAAVLPSACEGFGLPAMEAAACGTPVIATTASPLPQLLEGGGLFVQPGDIDALTDAMRVMLQNEPQRARMGAEARRRAGRLTWDTTAQGAMETIREAAA